MYDITININYKKLNFSTILTVYRSWEKITI